MSDFIVARNVRHRVPFIVHSWSETGLYFGLRRKRALTRVIVNHWTGSENPPAQLVANMRRIGVNVHFAVDQHGEAWQFMDADAHGAHCRSLGANAYSVGIEFINRGSDLSCPSRGFARNERVERVRGSLVRYFEMTERQVETGCLLNEALCNLFSLPFAVPHLAGDVFTSTFSDLEAPRVRGVCAHYMFEKKKVDPMPYFMRQLHAYGQQRSDPGPSVA